MVTYSINWMGPVTLKWYTDNNIDHTKESWCAGRIDIRGVEDEPFGLEYSLHMMNAESWGKLGEFLRTFSTKELLSYPQLIEEFEKNNKIIWWENE